MRVLTLGTFDTPHIGHAVFLNRCAELGAVTVGVNTDRFVTNYKGEPPLFTFDERASLIEQFGFEVWANDGPGYELINEHRPDYLVVGSDWAVRDYHGQVGVSQDELDALGIVLVFIPYTAGISSSEIRRRCA